MPKLYDYQNELEWSKILVVCMAGFAFYHKTIVGLEARKWAATLAGLVITVFILGDQSWYYILAVISSILLMKYVGWRKCHIVTLVYVFSCMLVFRLAQSTVQYHIRMDISLQHMLTALKLIGVAFDIHLTNNGKEKKASEDGSETSKHAAEDPINPDFVDLFHYTFSYMGMIVGPYLRYRTWDDYHKLPFARSCNPQELLRKLFPHVILSAIGCKIISYFFPIEYLLTAEFARRHFLFKNLFNFLHLARFKMWMTAGLFMAQCISGILGVGAYPTSLESVSTNGPTKDYSHLKNITQEEADSLEYEFETINTLNLYEIHWTPWHSEFWRNWNKTVQYFMGRYIYKEIFKDVTTDHRIVLTMLVSAYWHGIELGYFTSMVLCGVYMVAEKPYHKMYEYTTGWGSTAFLVAMWVIQAHIFGHLWMSFLILEPNCIFIHAAAMNFVPYFSLILFFLFGRVALSYLQKDRSLVSSKLYFWETNYK